MKKMVFVALCLFVLFAVILNTMPKLNYDYPLHVDEYVHWQYANHLSSGTPLYFNQIYGNILESGFHYLLALLNSFEISYLLMFRILPILITILICLGSFILTRQIWNEKAALFSVLFIALLASSAIILGPVFLVPMAIGLFMILIGSYAVEKKSKVWVLILALLLIMHPPTALAFFLLLNINLILKKEWIQNIKWQAVSGLIALPLYIPIFLSKGTETINNLAFAQIIPALFIPRYLGWVVLVFVLIGIYFTIEKKKYAIVSYVFALLAFILIFYRLEIEVFIPYARALMYLFVIFSVVFGIGLSQLIEIPKKKKFKLILGILLIGLILFFALPAKIDANKEFYRIVNEKDVLAFNWIKDNAPENAVVVTDPWIANALTPLAERPVYSRIVQGPDPIYEARNQEIDEFFNNNCTDTDFLERNNISIVYGDCQGTNLKEVYPRVYLK